MQNHMQTSGVNPSTFSNYYRSDWDFDGKSRDGCYAGAYFGNIPFLRPLQLDFRDEVMQDIISDDTQISLASSGILILPCPINNLIQIEGLLGFYDIDILDVNGMVQQSITSGNSIIIIDIQAIPAGIFFVSIKNKNNSQLFIQKLIKEG